MNAEMIGRFVETLGLPIFLSVVIGISISKLHGLTPSTFRERAEIEAVEEMIKLVVDKIDSLVFRTSGRHFSLNMLEEILNVEFGVIEDLRHLQLLTEVYNSFHTQEVLSGYFIPALQAALNAT